jgi:hypothetical protein
MQTQTDFTNLPWIHQQPRHLNPLILTRAGETLSWRDP